MAHRVIMVCEPTYLIVDAGPESTADITRASRVLEDHPPKLLADGICGERFARIELFIVMLRRVPRRWTSRRAVATRASR